MKINRNNYEAFFLDYHEGNLSDELRKELLIFVDENPDLKEAFESFELLSISAPDNLFFDKERLKKNTITLLNYKSFFIAYVEGDLNAAQKNETDIFIRQNPSLQHELEVFRKTKITPDFQLVYENKNQLKRGGKTILFTRTQYRVAIAASIALFLITYFILRNNKETGIAHQENHPAASRKEVIVSEKDSKPVEPSVEQHDVKKSLENKKTKEEFISRKQQDQTIAKKEIPEQKNNVAEPLLSKQNEKLNSNPVIQPQSIEKNDSSVNHFADNSGKTRTPFKPTTADLSKVFDENELKELGISASDPQNKKTSLWDLATKGANELSKVTGKDITLNKNESAQTNSFALAIGKFSIERSTGK